MRHILVALLGCVVPRMSLAIDVPANTWVRVAAPDEHPWWGADVRWSYDRHANELVMFGGDNLCYLLYCRTTWTYSVPDNRWTLRNDDNPPTSFPAGRCQPGMAYDPDRRQTLMRGGCFSRDWGDYSWGGLWSYDIATGIWQDQGGGTAENQMNTCNAGRRLSYDSQRGLAVMVAPHGWNNLAVWELDPATPADGWRLIEPPNPPFPDGDMYVPVVFDERRGNFITTTRFSVDANGDPNPYYDGDLVFQTWIYQPQTETFRRSTSPTHPAPPGTGHEIVYDSANDVVLFYGGNCSNELWVYHIDADLWEQLTPQGDIPGHSYFAMAYDSVDNVTVVWGIGTYCSDQPEDPPPVYLYRYAPAVADEIAPAAPSELAVR